MDGMQQSDRVSELAKQELAKLEQAEKDKAAKDAAAKAVADQKQKAEAEGAADGKSSAQDKKTAGDDQNQSKTDEEILKAKEEDLNDEEKSRRKGLEEAAEAAKSPEEKLKTWQEKTQKRIDSLVGELKSEKEARNQDKVLIKSLEDKIAQLQGDLEESGTIESETVKTSKTLKESWDKMVDEDKELPYDQRREMSKEDLEAFLIEDYTAAHEWLTRREFRRRDEQQARQKSATAVSKIEENKKTLFTKFPDLQKADARGTELHRQGVPDEEIFNTLSKEFPDFKLMIDVIREKPEFARLDNPDGPLQTAQEMDRRKGKPASVKKEYTEEELEQIKKDAIEAELRRRASIDQGMTNSHAGASGSTASKDPVYKKGLETFIAAGKARGKNWTEEDYQQTLKYGAESRR